MVSKTVNPVDVVEFKVTVTPPASFLWTCMGYYIFEKSDISQYPEYNPTLQDNKGTQPIAFLITVLPLIKCVRNSISISSVVLDYFEEPALLFYIGSLSHHYDFCNYSDDH